jgi:short-subunit dehydrogenase
MAHIISMCSASSIYGIAELAVYSATKHAIRGLTEALSIELEREDIVVSDIIAPFINTPMLSAAPVRAHSVDRIGITLQPTMIAELVWRAAYGKKVHWWIHAPTRALSLALSILPCLKRPVMKYLCLSPPLRT